LLLCCACWSRLTLFYLVGQVGFLGFWVSGFSGFLGFCVCVFFGGEYRKQSGLVTGKSGAGQPIRTGQHNNWYSLWGWERGKFAYLLVCTKC